MRLIVFSLLLASATPALAARDGAAADGSRGTVAIAASVAGAVRTAAPATLDAAGRATLCLWTNTATGGLRLISDGGGSAPARAGCSIEAPAGDGRAGAVMLVSPE